MTTKNAPTPNEVDELAVRYTKIKFEILQATLALTAANEPLGPLKDEIVDLVREYGSVHADKSKILHGIALELMATFGTSVYWDAAAIENFRLALVKAKQERLLKKIFQKDVRWRLSPEAAVVIKGKKLQPKLLALFSQCEVTTQAAPRLVVREKKK